ncbi:hypothetical protein MicB006_6241 [Micromonospora sp. B006]|nr:hypothetical protein MicB006_6241 [Micromonospora sp. B006]
MLAFGQLNQRGSAAGGAVGGHPGPADRGGNLHIQLAVHDYGACRCGYGFRRIRVRVPVRHFLRRAAEQRGHRPAVQVQPVRLGEVGHRGQREHPGDRLRGVRGHVQGQVPARGMADQDRRYGRHPAGQRRGGQAGQGGDPGADVGQRVRPAAARLAGPAVLDLRDRVAQRGQRRRHRAGVGPVVLGSPETAVHHDDERPRRPVAGWPAQVGELVRVIAVGDRRVRRWGRAGQHLARVGEHVATVAPSGPAACARSAWVKMGAMTEAHSGRDDEQGNDGIPGTVVVVGPDGRPVGTVQTEEGKGEDPTRLVEQPAKVMRIGSMIKQLLEEVKAAPLDDASRNRMREIHERSIVELKEGLAPELREELERISLPFTEQQTPSEGELRIAHAQLVGWLEGLFHGIQAALVAQQMAARVQLEQMRSGRQALPSGPGGVIPGIPGMPGPGGEGHAPGQYL